MSLVAQIMAKACFRSRPSFNFYSSSLLDRSLSMRFFHKSSAPGPKLQRPLSPHFTIYQPQLTWLMSIAHRMTGAALASAIYGFGLYYASTNPGAITSTFETTLQTIPSAWVSISKILLAWPFFYHTFNGIRHLIWDCGWALSIRSCYITGWIVNGGSALFTALVTFFF